MKKLTPIKTFAVIDCATDEPSIACYNRLLELGIPCSYHSANEFGTSTLKNLDLFYGGFIFGSMSHVHEDLPWHHELADWAKKALNKNFPLLGICFGHQLMCHHFGADVVLNQDKNPEQKGTRTVHFSKEFGEIKKGETREFAVSHSYRVEKLPESLEEIGYSILYRNDVVRHKTLPFVGLQPHPEASDHFIESDFSQNPPPRENAERTKVEGINFMMNFIQEYCKESFEKRN
jgi:GMP synthase-like glutamine amidotransferase